MNQNPSKEILDSYKIGPKELIILCRKHPAFALKKGCLLRSESSVKSWHIINRYLARGIEGKEELFEGEEIAYMKSEPHSKCVDIFVQKAKERERKREFLYRLQAIGHTEKPEQGEKLVLMTT